MARVKTVSTRASVNWPVMAQTNGAKGSTKPQKAYAACVPGTKHQPTPPAAAGVNNRPSRSSEQKMEVRRNRRSQGTYALMRRQSARLGAGDELGSFRTISVMRSSLADASQPTVDQRGEAALTTIADELALAADSNTDKLPKPRRAFSRKAAWMCAGMVLATGVTVVPLLGGGRALGSGFKTVAWILRGNRG